MELTSFTDSTPVSAERRTATKAKLEVSVVIPLRNEAKSLPFVIAGLQEQTYAPAEVVLVDGGSTDETIALARSLTHGDTRFRIIEAGEATPGRGRNLGTAAARYDWIAYADGGIRLEPTWLEYLVRETEADSSVEVVFGNYEPVTDTSFERAYASTYVAPKQHRPGGWMRGPVVPSSLIRRDVWKQVGGFPDWRAAEDLSFLERLESGNFKTRWAPQATVWWYPPPTLRLMFSKLVLYSRHNVWAGRQRYWHYGLSRIYLMFVPFVALAFVHSVYWWLVPFFLCLARVEKTLWTRRGSRSIVWVLNPRRILVTAVIMLVMDLATFVGWVQATWLRKWYQSNVLPNR